VRDIAAITYAANPHKKGLDRVLETWRSAARAGEELIVAGASVEELERAGIGGLGGDGARVVGRLAPDDYRAMLRRTRVFVCAPRREDYGIAQLEALAEGCRLVTSPAPGPYAALPIARELDPRLVGENLPSALRAALDDPLPDYAERARAAIEPFGLKAVERVVGEQLLPRLLS
jgi:glycosyltransferase involved in cell wall biosynthesis